MQTVLVTGGAGFIGSHTVVELAEAGYRPVIIDNFSNSKYSVIEALQKLLRQTVTYYEQDYQDTDKLRSVIAKEQVDSIVHFAAFKSVGESVKKPLQYYSNNVSGLVELFRFLDSVSIKNFVFSSSCTVYGEPDKLPVIESSPMKPATSPYGRTKQMGEIIVEDATRVSPALRSVSLRYFNPIGAHPSALIGELPIGTPNNLVPFLTQTAAGWHKELIVHGDDYPTPDGSAIRDYIHVVDLAKAHVKAIEYLKNKKARFYNEINVGTGEGHSVLDVIHTFENVTGIQVPYKIGPRREGDLVSTYASTNNANAILDWRAEKTLDDALEDAWRWQQTLHQ
jgi:UDP-glucose 4-epimerase